VEWATWISVGGRKLAFRHLDASGLYGALVPGRRYAAWIATGDVLLALTPA
jgi:hypothetical protein